MKLSFIAGLKHSVIERAFLYLYRRSSTLKLKQFLYIQPGWTISAEEKTNLRVCKRCYFHYFCAENSVSFHKLKSSCWNLPWYKLLSCFQRFQPLECYQRKGQLLHWGLLKSRLILHFCKCNFPVTTATLLRSLFSWKYINFLYKHHICSSFFF